MISWILGIILIVYVFIRRFAKGGRVEGYPLGLPRGTIRAIITLMIVSFPFNYIPPLNFVLYETQIPSDIVNTIFILVAFYFEARKSEDNRLKLLREIRKPLIAKEEKKKEKKPLYLPKYSIRITLLLLLVIFFAIDIYQPLNFEIQNTLIDILLIAILYFVGTFFRAVGVSQQRRKLREQVEKILNYQELSKYDILEKLDQHKKKANHFWKSVFSIAVFVAIMFSLSLYTFNLDFIFPLFITSVSLRRALLLLINLYYGFRD